MLRDPSHVRNQRVSEWKTLLQEASFSINSVREWTILLDIPSWTQRMRTPPASVATIEQYMHNASPAIRERLHIEEDPILSFLLPAVLIVATSISHTTL